MHRQWWIVSEQLHQEDQLDSVKTKLDTLHTDLAQLHSDLTVKDGVPVSIPDASGITAPLAASVDASGVAVKEAVWFLIGCVVAALFAYIIFRKLLP